MVNKLIVNAKPYLELSDHTHTHIHTCTCTCIYMKAEKNYFSLKDIFPSLKSVVFNSLVQRLMRN